MEAKPEKGPSAARDRDATTEELETRDSGNSSSSATEGQLSENGAATAFVFYKRRFYGLVHLVLLNIIVSWCWLTFSSVSTSSARYFAVSENNINWLSTGFLFAYVVASPVSMWTLNRGVKPAIIAASVLLLVGNWVRYAGARAGGSARSGRGTFGVVVLGQVIIGFAQPFVLAAPTRYSDMWFSPKGRITATAVTTLANPLGGALGQLISPFWVADTDQIPNMVLYIAVITTIITLPAPFIPKAPPTPPSTTFSFTPARLDLNALRTLFSRPSFHLLAWPFIIYVSAFNATSSLINQILHPYGYTETEAGITGALLILVGLVAAAITSPILDRFSRGRVHAVKVFVPVVSGMYLGLIFAPATRTVAAPYAIAAVLGATSFSLLPLALELLVEYTWPVGPEVGSTICWALGQLGGGIFILIMDALKGDAGAGKPKNSLYRALVFQAVLTWVVVPLPLFLGFLGTGREFRAESAKAQTPSRDED